MSLHTASVEQPEDAVPPGFDAHNLTKQDVEIGPRTGAPVAPRAFRSLTALLQSMKGWVENGGDDDGGPIIL